MQYSQETSRRDDLSFSDIRLAFHPFASSICGMGDNLSATRNSGPDDAAWIVLKALLEHLRQAGPLYLEVDAVVQQSLTNAPEHAATHIRALLADLKGMPAQPV